MSYDDEDTSMTISVNVKMTKKQEQYIEAQLSERLEEILLESDTVEQILYEALEDQKEVIEKLIKKICTEKQLEDLMAMELRRLLKRAL